MTIRKLLLIPAVLLMMLLAISACAVLKPIGAITVLDTEFATGDEHETEGRVSVTALVTGWVEAPAFILMDQKDPRTPDRFKDPQWVPSVTYVVTHPLKGSVIFDFGLKAGECDYGLKPVYWVPCRNDDNPSLAAYLRANEAVLDDVKYLIPSHFHGDHVSGLSDVLSLTDVPLLLTSDTLKDLKSPFRVLAGVPSEMVHADMDIVLMDDGFVPDPVLGESFDVFGDGSLKIFETAGHADGHISAVVQTISGAVLLTFDASHLSANYDLQIPTGAVTHKDEAIDSLDKLKTVSEAIGDVKMVFGHDPDQWRCVDVETELTSETHLGC